MSNVSPLRREAVRLLAALKKRVPKYAHLPFVVYQVAWSTGDETAPPVEEWQAVMNGEKPEVMHDWPGYEEHNKATLSQVQGTRIQPKLYLFDPSDCGTEP